MTYREGEKERGIGERGGMIHRGLIIIIKHFSIYI